MIAMGLPSEYLTTVGCRGDECKLLISNRPLFDSLSAKISELEDRATRIEAMFKALDGVVERLDADMQMYVYSPDKMYGAISKREGLIYDFERGLAVKAAEPMGIETFAAPVAGPENIGEIMAQDIAATKERIKKLQEEIDLLEGAVKECTSIIASVGADLLFPAVESEPVKEPVIHPAPNSPDSMVMVY